MFLFSVPTSVLQCLGCPNKTSNSMVETKTYGATDNFDEKNTYYLNESGFNWNRFARAAVPIIVALFIMGGLAFGMTHG